MKEFYHKIYKFFPQIKILKTIYNKIRGVEYARRYDYLFDAIRIHKCKRIMEIGTWDGERAVQMIEMAKQYHKAEEVEYYGFDIFELMNNDVFAKEVSKRPPPMDEVRVKLEATGAKIFLFKGFTGKTMPEVMPTLPKMDFVFIDGGHSIETITNDWRWTQLVMGNNTFVIFDDYWGGEWGKRMDAGCQSLIDNLDKTKFHVCIMPIQDSFKKDWGILKINFAQVRLRKVGKNSEFSERMRQDWEARSNENAYHWVDSRKTNWQRDEYYQEGMREINKYLGLLFSSGEFASKDLKKMRVLDIGCGTGRLTVALSQYFGQVDGVDISSAMVEIAKRDNPAVSNVSFYVNNGLDLGQFPGNFYDFVFSFITFQHIPSKLAVIRYFQEIYRVMKPCGWMQAQVRGYPGHLPSGLSPLRYKGFDRFYIALSNKRGVPLPVFHRYDTVLGVFFKEHELRSIVQEIGYVACETFYTGESRKYLWVKCKK